VRIIIVSIFLSLLINSGFSQPIPKDSLYLGQSPPGNVPKIFNLPVIPGFFACERIAISNDGKNIYYTELNSYYVNKKVRIKYLRYDSNKWTGPFNLFEGCAGPGLSITGDTMYMANFFSVKNDTGWSNPKRCSNLYHYFQVTNSGNYYASTKPNISIGDADISKLVIHGADTTALSLGLPINTKGDDGDFYVAKDESFIIFSSRGLGRSPVGNIVDLFISYRKSDNEWTNPKDLGSRINNAFANTWSPYVTADNKYLFFYYYYNDNSKNYVHWVKIDNVIDSLKHTNFVPYLKNQIKEQTGSLGHLFSFSIPEDTFIDDDGNKTLTYYATLSDGNLLPSWLRFETSTGIFSGTPTETGELSIKVIATDIAKASTSCTFQLLIR